MAPEPQCVDVIVIGGGIAGLAAARDMAKRRLRVALLEARARMGGRIHTQRPDGWPRPVEMGAEFIHVGNADLWRLVRKAQARAVKLPDDHWFSERGEIQRIPDLDRKIGAVTGLIKPAKAGGLSFAAYFHRFPPAVRRDEWMLARSFVEGFEAAPLGSISAKSLAGEAMDEQHQFVVPGGYDQVLGRIVRDCTEGGVSLFSNMIVRTVAWRRGSVRVSATNPVSGLRTGFSARAAVIALPLGVLKARSGLGAVRFSPILRRKRAVIAGMQMGHVVRIAVRFSEEGWRAMLPGRLKRRRPLGFGFIHSTVKGVPVWWSLSDQPIMVGWAGGPAAKALLRVPAATRRRRALASLAEILGKPAAVVRAAVRDMQAWDWTNDPFSRGAYSFTAAGRDEAGAELRRPVRGTLFFAGEATAQGDEVGTTHGALASGRRAAREVVREIGRPRRGGR